MSNESKFTAKGMGQGFIDNLNVLLEKWTPRNKYDLIKIKDDTLPSNYQTTPITLNNEFYNKVKQIKK